MRKTWLCAALCGVALLTLPVAAAIKAMNLKELMGITHETVLVRITAQSTFQQDFPTDGAVWTRLSVQGESLRTGEAFSGSVVFLGSHDPADGYGTSEMPTLQDTRNGARIVLFAERLADFPGGAQLVAHNLSYVYRVEDGFGPPVVIGKGEGSAFPDNVKLADVAVQVRATHLELAAQAAGK